MMSFFEKTSNPILAWTMVAYILLPAHTSAQEIEEVVIQAEQSENAPINELSSAALLDGEKLADAGIENVEDVAAYVPNLVLTETSTGTNIVIRGIGAGVNQGFDQSVGLYSDSVPLPRSQMARAPFLDLAGVQVLRGPQYVKDGNYSIAGSVHMLSKTASDTFEFDVDATIIPSQNEKKLLLTLGTPITDKLGLRLALERKTSDGYIENVARSEDGPQADNLFVRTVFNYEASDNFSIKLKYEKGRFDTRGRQIEIIESQDTPDFRTFFDGGATPPGLDPLTDAREAVSALPATFQTLAPYTTETDFLYNGTFYDVAFSGGPGPFSPADPPGDPAYAGRSYLQVLHDLYTGRVPLRPDGTPSQSAINNIPFSTPALVTTPPPGLLDSTLDFRRAANEDEFSNNDSENITLNLDYNLGEHTFKFVASVIDYEVDERIDTDFTPVPILVTDQTEEYEQNFFRFDYESPKDGFVEVAFGASYLDSELQFLETISDGVGGPTTQQEAADFLFRATQVGSVDVQTDFIQFDPERPFLSYFGRTSIPAIQALEFFEIDRQFDQSAETTAAFFDLKFNISDRFRAIVGARYTKSEKQAVRDLAFVLRSGEPFSEIGLLDALPFARESDRRNAFNNLVNQLGFIYNFQLHTDRIPQQQVIDDDGISVVNFFGSPTISGIPASTVEGCENQVSFALGGPCDPNGGGRREEQLLPSIALQFDVTQDLSMYVAVQKANKLGGFDARSVSTPTGSANFGIDPGTFEFEDEDATTYELGGNWFLPNGWGELRGALFYTEFTNLQVSAADRSVGQNVRNAASATTLGIELEGLLQFSDLFNITYALAWTEFEFGDYPLAACALEERADGILVTASNSPFGEFGEVVPIFYEESNLIPFTGNAPVGNRPAPTGSDPNQFILFEDSNGEQGVADTLNGGTVPVGATELLTFGPLNAFSSTELGPRVCQFEGRTNQFVAEYQGTVSFNYRQELRNLNIVIKPTLDVLYNSGYETTVRQDSDVAQKEYAQFNGRLAIASLEEAWELALVGENITNEKIVGFASEVPIATRIQGSKSHFGFVRPPRSFGINFRYKFY